jgi:hypothetical protein
LGEDDYAIVRAYHRALSIDTANSAMMELSLV